MPPLRPSVVVAAWYLAIVLALLATHAWDPAFFATLGPQWQRHDPELTRRADGIIYHQFAVDPGAAVARHDRFRTARILYPMTARVLALGRADLVPWTLVLVNLLAIVLGTEVLHRLLERRGLPVWAALAYGGWAGLGLALLHDTAEPLAYLCALLGVAAMERERTWLACVAFAAALLGRETTILLIAPYVLLGRGRAPFRWPLPVAAVLVTLVGWGLFLGFRGTGRWLPRLGWRPPLYGYTATETLDLPATVLYLVLPGVALAAGAVWTLRHRPADPALWAILLNALLVIWLPVRVAELLWHSARISTGLVLATLLAAELARSAPRWWRAFAVLMITSASWTLAVTVRFLCCDVVRR